MPEQNRVLTCLLMKILKNSIYGGHLWFQNPRTPATRVGTGEISQIFCGISWRHDLLVGPLGMLSGDRANDQITLTINKNGCAREEIYFLSIYTTLFILMSMFNVLTHLIKLIFYSGYQCMHCTVLLCVQYNVK